MQMKNNKTVFNLPQGFTVTGHTGCMDTPANSLESLTVALQNADIVEVDISVLEDGTLALFHGHRAPEGSVPLKAAFEVLAQYPDKRMNLDLKMFDHCAELQAGAEPCGVRDQVFCTGVFKSEVERISKDAPKIPYYLNININPFLKYSISYAHRLVKTVQSVGAIGMNCNFMSATSLLVNAFHKQGMLVSIWTVRNDCQMKKVLRLAPDNLTTTIPDRVNACLASEKKPEVSK